MPETCVGTCDCVWGQMRQGVEMIIATPGRLIDCLERRLVVLNQVRNLLSLSLSLCLSVSLSPSLSLSLSHSLSLSLSLSLPLWSFSTRWPGGEGGCEGPPREGRWVHGDRQIDGRMLPRDGREGGDGE